MAHAKVAIVGVGRVGSTIAHTLLMGGIVSDIVLIDQNKDRADGHMLDFMHAAQFTSNLDIRSGDDYSLLHDAQIVIVAAGKAQSLGQSRDDLLQDNCAVFADIIPKIIKHNPSCVLLVVTNPLDVMTYVAWKLSGFPANRVLGTGTMLDSARLRYYLGKRLGISSHKIEAHMLGHHGPFAFPWWSQALVDKQFLKKNPKIDINVRAELTDQVHNSAGTIIAKKGGTQYGISLVVAEIVHAILQDKPESFTVSMVHDSYQGFNGIAFSVPAIVRSSGVEKVLNIHLDDQEQEHLRRAAIHIRSEIACAIEMLSSMCR